MARRGILILLVVVLVACANDYGTCTVEHRPKSVTTAEFHALIGAARHYIYGFASVPPPGPIYRVRFISPTKAQVWYGDSKSDSKSYQYFDRTKDGWRNSGSGLSGTPAKT